MAVTAQQVAEQKARTELQDIRSAIHDMGMGKRVGEVTMNGRRVRFADVTLNELKAHEKELATRISRSSRPRYSQIVTGKGL